MTQAIKAFLEADALLPPEGYRLYTVDASIEGRASIMFILKKELRDDWHLQGEVLDASGKDVRPELFITRIFDGYLENAPDLAKMVEDMRVAKEALEKIADGNNGECAHCVAQKTINLFMEASK